MLVPEIWCRMTPAEREPAFLIANGYLEKVGLYEKEKGYLEKVRISLSRAVAFWRAGWDTGSRRSSWTGFSAESSRTPDAVLARDDAPARNIRISRMFAAGVDAIVEAQRQVALEYFQDGSVEAACPPVKAVLHLMAHGNYLGMAAEDPKLRAMFTRESILAERLVPGTPAGEAGEGHRSVDPACSIPVGSRTWIRISRENSGSANGWPMPAGNWSASAVPQLSAGTVGHDRRRRGPRRASTLRRLAQRQGSTARSGPPVLGCGRGPAISQPHIYVCIFPDRVPASRLC